MTLNLTEKVKKLESARASVARLELEIAFMLNLPAAGIGAMVVHEEIKKKRKRKRTRAVITDDTRAQVKKLVLAGKAIREISEIVGIAPATAQNIKKALGLVKKK